MIEEIIPTFTPHRTVKMLSADNNIINKLPAIDSHISFLPFVNFLKDKLAITSGTRSDFYRYLIRRFEAEPELLDEVKNVQILDEHGELMELLSTVIFPVVSDEQKNNFTLSTPYQFNIFSYSESFKKLFIDEAETILKFPPEVSETYLRQVQCSTIYDHVLEKYYGHGDGGAREHGARAVADDA